MTTCDGCRARRRYGYLLWMQTEENALNEIMAGGGSQGQYSRGSALQALVILNAEGGQQLDDGQREGPLCSIAQPGPAEQMRLSLGNLNNQAAGILKASIAGAEQPAAGQPAGQQIVAGGRQ